MAFQDADKMANSVDPDQTASLIWVYTVFTGPSVRKLRNITVSQAPRLETRFFQHSDGTSLHRVHHNHPPIMLM